jgi:hypothetical protein
MRKADRNYLNTAKLPWRDCHRKSNSWKKILSVLYNCANPTKVRPYKVNIHNLGVEGNSKILLYLLLLKHLESVFVVKRGIAAILLSLHSNNHTCWHGTFLCVDNTKILTTVSKYNATYVGLIRLFFDPLILISKLRFCIIYFRPSSLACTICFLM